MNTVQRSVARGGCRPSTAGPASDTDVAELERLLLHERARAGRAHVVHVRVADVAVHQVHVLGVLPADLEDRVDRRIDLRRARHVRGDLVDDRVGADDVAHDLPAAPGRAHARDVERGAPVAGERPDRPEEALGRVDRIAGRLPVDVGDDIAGLVYQDRLGAGRADVDADVGANRLALGPARDAHLVAIGVLVVLLGRECRVPRFLERERPRKAAVPVRARRLAPGRERQAVRGRHGRERRPVRRDEVRLLGHVDEPGAVGSEPVHHLLVQRDAAEQDGLAFERPPAEQRAEHGPRHAAAQARPHVHPAAALLLAVDEVALREHRAARGDGRRIGVVQEAPGVVIGNAQPARLLVEERAGARGAQRIGRVPLELALAVELDERGRPAADVHHGERVGRHPADGVNLAQRHVAVGHVKLHREHFGVAAGQPDRLVGLDGQPVERLGQHVGGLAAVPLIHARRDPALVVHPDGLQIQRTDVDADPRHKAMG